MKHLILSIITILSVTNVSAQWSNKKVKGNGNMTTITRTTTNYEGINCAGSFDYILVAGKEGNITIEGESNLLEYIITEVKDNHLVVKLEDNINLQSSSNKNIKITIPFDDINSVSLAGSGDLWSESIINGTNFNVSLAGSGKMNLLIETQSIKGSVAGSGDLTLKGKTLKMEANLAGSGNFNGFELQSNDTDISVAGSGDAKVVSKENLKARVAGSGDIFYKGNPKKEDSKISGSGKIEIHQL